MSEFHKARDEDTEARFNWLRAVTFGPTRRSDDRHRALQPLPAAQMEVRARTEPFGAEGVATSRPSSLAWKSEKRWICKGPWNVAGRIRSLAICPSDPEILYAGSATGGVWRTDNAGLSWYPLMHMREPPSIGAIAIDPVCPTTVYVGTGEPYVRLLYPGVGLLKSENGGASWQLIGPNELTRVIRVVIHPEDNKIIYCAGYEGLFKSRDGGSSWSRLCFGNVTDLKLGKENALMIGVYGEGIFKRNDDGEWENVTSALSQPHYRALFSLASCRVCQSDLIYVKLDDDVLYKTSTCDQWWHLGRVEAQTDRDWASLLAAHPHIPHRVFAGGEYLKVIEVDCQNPGSSAEKPVTLCRDLRSEDHPFPDQHDMAFHPERPNIAYAANDAGVFRSEDGGYTWCKRSDRLAVTQFYDLSVSPHDPNDLGGGTQDRGTWIRRAGIWIQTLHMDGGHVAFDPRSRARIWCQHQGNQVVKVTMIRGRPVTTDWFDSLEGKGPFVGTLLAIESGGGTILFTGRSKIYRDIVKPCARKDTWKAISPELGGEVSAIAYEPSWEILLVGTTTGELWEGVKDYGHLGSWNRIIPISRIGENRTRMPIRHVTRIVPVSPAKNSEMVFYVCFGGGSDQDDNSGHVFRCSKPTDGPWVWADRSGQISTTEQPKRQGERLPDVATFGLAFDQRDGKTLFVCTDIGVYRSDDAGDTWHDFSNGLPNVPCFDIHLWQDEKDLSKPGLLRVATHGRGIWEIEV